MTLRELINIEEKLLQFENDNKFKVNFNDYIALINCLKNIDEITSNYFLLMEDYDIELQKLGMTLDEYKNTLKEYNDKLLNSNVECEVENGLNIIEKYQ